MKKKNISIHEISYNLLEKSGSILKVKVTYFDGATETLYGESMNEVAKVARENLRKRLTASVEV